MHVVVRATNIKGHGGRFTGPTSDGAVGRPMTPLSVRMIRDHFILTNLAEYGASIRNYREDDGGEKVSCLYTSSKAVENYGKSKCKREAKQYLDSSHHPG